MLRRALNQNGAPRLRNSAVTNMPIRCHAVTPLKPQFQSKIPLNAQYSADGPNSRWEAYIQPLTLS